MPKKSIVFLISSLNTGGAEIQLFRIISRLNREMYAIAVVSLLDIGPVGRMIDQAGVPVYALDLKGGKSRIKALGYLHGIIRENKPDLLVAFMYHADMLARLFGFLMRIPVISSVRTINLEGRTKELIYKITQGWSKYITFNSRISAEYFVRSGIVSPGRVKIIPNGIDLNAFFSERQAAVSIRQELGIGSGDFVWICVGRLDPAKNHLMLIEAFGSLLKAYRCQYLVIAGEGPCRKKCEEKIEELGLEKNIKLLGNRTDISELILASDAFILSSSWEGMPNALMEAMCLGIPCLATSVGGVIELIEDEKTGLLVNPNSTDSLLRGMIKMVELSDEEKKKIGEHGRAFVANHFSIDKVIEMWEEIFDVL